MQNNDEGSPPDVKNIAIVFGVQEAWISKTVNRDWTYYAFINTVLDLLVDGAVYPWVHVKH